jgi:hypothetical protein
LTGVGHIARVARGVAHREHPIRPGLAARSTAFAIERRRRRVCARRRPGLHAVYDLPYASSFSTKRYVFL